jgi:hypothetical protein
LHVILRTFHTWGRKHVVIRFVVLRRRINILKRRVVYTLFHRHVERHICFRETSSGCSHKLFVPDPHRLNNPRDAISRGGYLDGIVQVKIMVVFPYILRGSQIGL